MAVKLSIVIPVYNVEKYVTLCVNSILANNITDDIEILLIDDGSTDSSGVICDRLSSLLPNIKTFHKENGGLSDARNYGIEKASGEYISFIDSDDMISPNSIDYVLRLLQKQPDIIHLGRQEFWGDKLTPTDGKESIVQEYKSGLECLVSLILQKKMIMCAPYGIYKTELVLKNDRFQKGIIHEDELWTPQQYLKAKSVITSDFCFYYYRKRPESITTSKDKTRGSNDIVLICKFLEDKYRVVDNKRYRNTLRDYLCTLYLSAYIDWIQSGKKEIENSFDRLFVIRNAKTLRNLLKSIVFVICPSLYGKVYEVIVNEK